MPTLKTFGASTFFSNFCRPLTWEQLEAREGTLGVSYSPDLLDLFFAFLSFHGTLPIPFFRATPDALEKVLLQGCYRPPGDLAGLFHITQEPHETPVNFYTRAFLLPLRFPCLTTLGLTPPDIFAIESAVRQELLRVPLPQALDFLHSQILAILCVNAPRRPKGKGTSWSRDVTPPLRDVKKTDIFGRLKCLLPCVKCLKAHDKWRQCGTLPLACPLELGTRNTDPGNSSSKLASGWPILNKPRTESMIMSIAGPFAVWPPCPSRQILMVS